MQFGSEFRGLAHARPPRRRLGRPPPQVAHGRRREGDALEGDDSVVDHPLQFAAIHPHDCRRLRTRRGANTRRDRQRGQRAHEKSGRPRNRRGSVVPFCAHTSPSCQHDRPAAHRASLPTPHRTGRVDSPLAQASSRIGLRRGYPESNRQDSRGPADKIARVFAALAEGYSCNPNDSCHPRSCWLCCRVPHARRSVLVRSRSRGRAVLPWEGRW